VNAKSLAGWKWATLADVAAPIPNAIVDGPFGSNLKLDDYVGSGVPVLQGKNVTGDSFRWLDVRFISPAKAIELKRSSVRVGDILLVKIGSIGYSAIVDDLNGYDHAIIPANLAKVTPDPHKVNTRYLHHWLTSPDSKRYLIESASQTAQPALSLTKFKKLAVPLPPLEEQRRIATILDKADALRQKRRIALQKLDSLTQSIFLDMFADPVANGFSFPMVPVSSFVSQFETGKSIAPNEDENADSRFRVLKVSAVTSHDYRPEESKPIPDGYLPPESHFVKPGDLLFSRANTADLIGATAYVASAEKNRLLPDKIWRFIWRDTAKIEPLFVWFLFRQPSIRRAIAQLATGTSGSMKNISQEKVLGIRVGLPPIAKQRRFASAVSLWMRSRANMCSSMKMLGENFASLQHRAFRGEL
jgi:type I restriction enzyme S subunit